MTAPVAETDANMAAASPQASAPYTAIEVEPAVKSSYEIPKLGITWRNVCFSVKIKNPKTKKLEDKQILRGVNGAAAPGELMVLMGPSGAGKSTLLDCIAGRNLNCTGDILVNGRKWSKAIAKHTCYVMQDDLFYANLTVIEHLMFQAQLRMCKNASPADREQRVQQIVSELGLTKVINTPIGDTVVKGLSGGQRKRLSFATELLTNPSLLFVDEPTSGLDSFMAETVVLQMQALARRGRTVIATIHQPSSELFQIFDKLFLLVDGRTVYNGPAADSIAHFAAQGLQCPAFMNPTDYFMKQLVVLDELPESRPRVDMLINAWAEKEKALPVASASADGAAADDAKATDRAPGFWGQLAVLCRRNFLRLVRDTIGFKARIGSTLFISLLVGLIFLQRDLTQKGVQDFTGAMFFITVNSMFSSANPEFISVPLEVPLVLREHNGGLYNVVTWYLAKNLSELPFQFFFPAIFLVPAYFMIGFGNDATVFFTFYLFVMLNTSAATGLGYFVSCVAKRVDVAPIIGILLMLPFLIFGGLFLNSDSTPDYFIWLQQVSPIKYAFHGVMRAFWSDVPSISCAPGSRCPFATGADVLEQNSVKPGRLWSDAIILVAINLAFRLGGAFFLWRRARNNPVTG
ncbi:hypothetical protein ATCC90586_002356 [Pythium insidiosum]|nr:hypothetical protein ATCC90586_002356 [Pythium insidiosum]